MNDRQLKESASLSDVELVGLIGGGDYSLYSVLIDRYMPHILSCALSKKSLISDTENLIGEGVLALFFAVKSFDGKKSSFKTFANLCIDRAIASRVKAALSQKRIPDTMISSIDEVALTSSESPEEIVIKREETDNLKDAILSNLTQLEKGVFSHFINGETYAVIAEKLGVTVKSVDSAMQRIRTKLKK